MSRSSTDGLVPADLRGPLLDLAWQAVRAQVLGTSLPHPAPIILPMSGLFVTLHRGRELRGCLGTLASGEPIATAVVRLATAVCHQDWRFAPVAPDELPDLRVELSVLTPLVQVTNPGDIEVGRDGLVVEQGGRKGLLLPQVPVEHGWDRERFLAETCTKAGLPRDAWRGGARLSRFEADVFERPAGEGPAS